MATVTKITVPAIITSNYDLKIIKNSSIPTHEFTHMNEYKNIKNTPKHTNHQSSIQETETKTNTLSKFFTNNQQEITNEVLTNQEESQLLNVWVCSRETTCVPRAKRRPVAIEQNRERQQPNGNPKRNRGGKLMRARRLELELDILKDTDTLEHWRWRNILKDNCWKP